MRNSSRGGRTVAVVSLTVAISAAWSTWAGATAAAEPRTLSVSELDRVTAGRDRVAHVKISATATSALSNNTLGRLLRRMEIGRLVLFVDSATPPGLQVAPSQVRVLLLR